MMDLFHILLSNDIAERLQTTLTLVISVVQMNMGGFTRLSWVFSDKNAYRVLKISEELLQMHQLNFHVRK